MVVDSAQIEDFALPSLGSDMDEGTVLIWLVGPGDHVTKGDVLLRVDTEKAEIDVEVWHDAVVVELLVGPGDTVPVGTALARLQVGAGSTSSPQSSPVPASSPQSSPVPASSPQSSPVPASSPQSSPVPASSPQPPPVPASSPQSSPVLSPRPPVTAQARIERPTAHNGRTTEVTPRLVYWPTTAAHSIAPTSSPEVRPSAPDAASDGQQSRAERRQAAVAALMEQSNREIPHFHLSREIDLNPPLAWLEEHNAAVAPPARILPAALLLYAVAHAAADTPINGTFVDQPIDAEHVNLGVAVHVRGGGLMTPVLPHANEMELDTLMAELHAMVARARASRLGTRDMTPATLTVTNLGDAGVDSVLGVIRPPERALVGFGRIADRPVAIDGNVVVRTTVQVTLSADHRVVNGHAAARFLDDVATILSKPTDMPLAGVTP